MSSLFKKIKKQNPQTKIKAEIKNEKIHKNSNELSQRSFSLNLSVIFSIVFQASASFVVSAAILKNDSSLSNQFMFILKTSNPFEITAASEKMKNETRWFLTRKYDWTFKKTNLYEFFSFNTILNDFLIWKIAVSNLPDDEKHKRWFINFASKSFINTWLINTNKVAKALNKKIWKYVIVKKIELHEAEKQLIKFKKKRGKKTIFRTVSLKTDVFFRSNEILSENKHFIRKAVTEIIKNQRATSKKRMNKNLLNSFLSSTFISRKDSSSNKKKDYSFQLSSFHENSKSHLIFFRNFHGAVLQLKISRRRFITIQCHFCNQSNFFFQSCSNFLNLSFWHKILFKEQYMFSKIFSVWQRSEKKIINSNLFMNVLAPKKQWTTKKKIIKNC